MFLTRLQKLLCKILMIESWKLDFILFLHNSRFTFLRKINSNLFNKFLLDFCLRKPEKIKLFVSFTHEKTREKLVKQVKIFQIELRLSTSFERQNLFSE